MDDLATRATRPSPSHLHPHEPNQWRGRAAAICEIALVAGAGHLHRSLPRQYALARRVLQRVAPHAERDPEQYAQECYAAIAPHCPGGRTLEIGPGLAGGVSPLIAQDGCDAFAADILDLSGSDLTAAGARHGRPAVTCFRSSIESLPFADASFDFVFSVACFEHFRDPNAALAELWRVLRPGGRTVHQIDLRDHRHFDDPLRYLRYSDAVWAFMHPLSFSMYQNRWRLSQYRRAFTAHGFRVTMNVNKHATPSQLLTLRTAAPRFRRLSDDDATSLGCLVVADKPVAGK